MNGRRRRRKGWRGRGGGDRRGLRGRCWPRGRWWWQGGSWRWGRWQERRWGKGRQRRWRGWQEGRRGGNDAGHGGRRLRGALGLTRVQHRPEPPPPSFGSRRSRSASAAPSSSASRSASRVRQGLLEIAPDPERRLLEGLPQGLGFLRKDVGGGRGVLMARLTGPVASLDPFPGEIGGETDLGVVQPELFEDRLLGVARATHEEGFSFILDRPGKRAQAPGPCGRPGRHWGTRRCIRDHRHRRRTRRRCGCRVLCSGPRRGPLANAGVKHNPETSEVIDPVNIGHHLAEDAVEPSVEAICP